MVLYRSLFVYLPGEPRAEARIGAGARVRFLEVMKIGVGVPLLLIWAHLTSLSLLVREGGLWQMCGPAI